jgi:single-stranded DNA-specific DHH superfamily exonuclease
MAAGFNIRFENRYDTSVIERFRETIIADYRRQSERMDSVHMPLRIDAVARVEELTARLLDQFAALRPFGLENPFPIIALLNCGLSDERGLSVVGANHLKLRLTQPADNGHSGSGSIGAIWFQCPDIDRLKDVLSNGASFDVCGVIYMSAYSRCLEFKVKDLRLLEE